MFEILLTWLVGAIVILLLSIMDGIVIAALWAWFVMPVFVSAPSLYPWRAAGIGIFVGFLTLQIDSDRDVTTLEAALDRTKLQFKLCVYTLICGFLVWMAIQVWG